MIVKVTSKQIPKNFNELKGKAIIMISNYSMMSYSGTRSEESSKLFDAISNLKWGLMILDEVHVAPAKKFRKVMERYKAFCKLGLTATLVREDMKIEDLYYLIGPKLYEANWTEL